MKTILIFPKRGCPPPEQPGYVRDPGNPYLFRLAPVPCVHRTERGQPRTGCCAGGTLPYCTFFDLPVGVSICQRCEVPSKGQLPENEP